MNKPKMTHLDDSGRGRMVDVSQKPQIERWAVARGVVEMSPETLKIVEKGDLKKGDLRAAAELAGIMAAKRTSDLIPLCHPLSLTHVDVDVEIFTEIPGISIKATVRTIASTGVEMEALTAVAVAALTVYDMVKAVEPEAKITRIRLVEKHGGKKGDVVYE
jgi:cyclic pyranopterin phosphate synthase